MALETKDVKIPVYNLAACLGAGEFAVSKFQPEPLFTKLMIPHRQELYSITMLVRGSVTKFIDFEKYEVTAPAIISMGPGQIQQYLDTENAEMICVSFSREFVMLEMQGWIACWECMFGHVVMTTTEEELNELLSYADIMMREFSKDRARKDAVIRNVLQAFIISVARLRTPSVPVMQVDNQQNKLVHQFKEYVDEHFRTKTQVAQYAEMLFITPGHLNDVIRSTVGKTAKQVIDEKRVTEAKRLLFFAAHPIKEISSLLSFDDDAYFNRFFKKHSGYTPAEFQRTIRQKYN